MIQRIHTFIILAICLNLAACMPTSRPTNIAVATYTAVNIQKPTETPTPTLIPLTISIEQQTKCFGGPGESGYILVASFERGEQIDLVGRDATGQYWIVIDRKSGNGCWVNNQSVSVQGDTTSLPVLIPAPTVTTRPNPPLNLKISVDCKKIKYTTQLGIPTESFSGTIIIKWDDMSSNEIGFELYKNNTLLTTLDANVSQFVESFDSGNVMYFKTIYTVLAFNETGKSARISSNLIAHCP